MKKNLEEEYINWLENMLTMLCKNYLDLVNASDEKVLKSVPLPDSDATRKAIRLISENAIPTSEKLENNQIEHFTKMLIEKQREKDLLDPNCGMSRCFFIPDSLDLAVKIDPQKFAWIEDEAVKAFILLEIDKLNPYPYMQYGVGKEGIVNLVDRIVSTEHISKDAENMLYGKLFGLYKEFENYPESITNHSFTKKFGDYMQNKKTTHKIWSKY